MMPSKDRRLKYTTSTIPKLAFKMMHEPFKCWQSTEAVQRRSNRSLRTAPELPLTALPRPLVSYMMTTSCRTLPKWTLASFHRASGPAGNSRPWYNSRCCSGLTPSCRSTFNFRSSIDVSCVRSTLQLWPSSIVTCTCPDTGPTPSAAFFAASASRSFNASKSRKTGHSRPSNSSDMRIRSCSPKRATHPGSGQCAPNARTWYIFMWARAHERQTLGA
mmetsp:Transcript_57706/g.130148  ORF Transcript_57706/g.130148 Transcript_57706/m.130148 type:complete len:218 (+) Transcript_57706:451-1104(+)